MVRSTFMGRTVLGVMHLCSTQPSPSWAGSVGGRALRGRGVLLEHKASAAGIEEAREQARVRVQLHHVRDWVIDYSEPGAVWIISDWAWYRCVILMPDLHGELCAPHPQLSTFCLNDDPMCLLQDACY